MRTSVAFVATGNLKQEKREDEAPNLFLRQAMNRKFPSPGIAVKNKIYVDAGDCVTSNE